MVAEVLDAENVSHLKAAGADEVIETTKVGFSLLAHAVSMPGSANLLSHLASVGGQSVYVGRSNTAGLCFGEVAGRLKRETGALLIGCQSPETGQEIINPEADWPIPDDMVLLYLATEPVLPKA